MDWILFWQIVGPIIGAIGSGFLIHYLTHREKVEVKHANMLAKLKMDKDTHIHIEYSFALFYTKGTRDQYIGQIWVEFDKHLWKKLKRYFNIPLIFGGVPMPMSDGLGHGPGDERKLELGKPQWFGSTWSFPAWRTLTEGESKNVDDLLHKLWHRYKIGWKDTYGKTHWKTIHQLKEIEKRGIL